MSTLADNKKQLAKIIAHAWVDPAYKEQLVARPDQVFRTEGIEVPAHVKLSVVEDTPQKVNLVLSSKARLQGSIGERTDLYSVLAIAYDKALADATFKAALIAAPTDTVRGLGAELPAGLEIAVHSETDSDRFFALPLPPKARIRVELGGSASIGIEEGGPAPAAMLLKGHPETKPVNVQVNVNTGAAVNVGAVTNAAISVNAATTVNAAAVATVVVAAVVLI